MRMGMSRGAMILSFCTSVASGLCFCLGIEALHIRLCLRIITLPRRMVDVRVSITLDLPRLTRSCAGIDRRRNRRACRFGHRNNGRCRLRSWHGLAVGTGVALDSALGISVGATVGSAVAVGGSGVGEGIAVLVGAGVALGCGVSVASDSAPRCTAAPCTIDAPLSAVGVARWRRIGVCLGASYQWQPGRHSTASLLRRTRLQSRPLSQPTHAARNCDVRASLPP
jgi:hypothetical protein